MVRGSLLKKSGYKSYFHNLNKLFIAFYSSIFLLLGGCDNLPTYSSTFQTGTNTPTAAKRLSQDSIQPGEWTEVNLIVHGYSRRETNCVPFEVVLLIDQSGSMDWNDENNDRLIAAKQFVTRISQENCGIRVALVPFNDEVEEDAVVSLTESYGTVISAIDNLEGEDGGGTSIVTAMSTAQNILITNGNPNLTRAIVLITDGRPSEAERSEILDKIEQSIQNDLRYYTIGLGNDIDEGLLATMAQHTGGFYRHASEGVSSIYSDIFEELAFIIFARNIILHEQLATGLKVREGSLSGWPEEEGVPGPDSMEEQGFYDNGNIEIHFGTLRSGEERSISFQITSPACLTPDSPQESIELPVDQLEGPNPARLSYRFGSGPQIEIPVEQRMLICLRPGALRCDKQLDDDTLTVHVSCKNRYTEDPTHPNIVRNIHIKESLFPAFQYKEGTFSFSDSCGVNPIYTPWALIPDETIDTLAFKLDELKPQEECILSFQIQSRACTNTARPTAVNLWYPDKGYTEKSESTVEFQKPDGNIERIRLPQRWHLLSNTDDCDGRPNLFVSPALTTEEFFELNPQYNPFPTGYILFTPDPPGLAHDSWSIWIDSPDNGYVTDWQDETHIRTHQKNFQGFSNRSDVSFVIGPDNTAIPREVIVSGRGDTFRIETDNKIYVQFENTGTKPAIFTEGETIDLFAYRVGGVPGYGVWGRFEKIGSKQVPELIFPNSAVLVAIDVPANTISLQGIGEKFAYFRVNLPTAINQVVEKHTNNNIAYEMMPIGESSEETGSTGGTSGPGDPDDPDVGQWKLCDSGEKCCEPAPDFAKDRACKKCKPYNEICD